MISNMKSLLICGAPVWYTLLRDTCKQNIERVQRSATRVIYPGYDKTTTSVWAVCVYQSLIDIKLIYVVSIIAK